MSATAEVPVKTTDEQIAEHDRMILDLQSTVADFGLGKIVPPQLHDLQAELFRVIDHVKELQATIEDLIAGGVATKTGHTVRARVAHDFTVKEGHRLKETTVEFTSGSDGAIDWDRIDTEMMNAYVRGLIQANYRNSTPNPVAEAITSS